MADIPTNDIIRACNVIKTTGKLLTVKNDHPNNTKRWIYRLVSLTESGRYRMITIIRCKNHTLHINNTVYAFSDKGHLYTVILTSDICSYRCINMRWHAKVINILIIVRLAKPLLYKYTTQDPTLCKGSFQSNLSKSQ